MIRTNIPLWERDAPIALLPPEARGVSLDRVLGACFWVIGTIGTGWPETDPHVPHKGRRGGTMWTRRYGQLEGVTPKTRISVEQAAAAAGLAVHAWFEQALCERLTADQPSSTASPKPERP